MKIYVINLWVYICGRIIQYTNSFYFNKVLIVSYYHISLLNHIFIFSLGTDRSSIFIVMCILVQQLRVEKKIDICSTVRKLRSQRNLLIDSYVIIYYFYWFLHIILFE